MNSNGNRFVLLTGDDGLRASGNGCAWDAGQGAHEETPGRSQVSSSPSGGLQRSGRFQGAITLQRQDQPRLPQLGSAAALALWQSATPLVQDDHGQLGRLSDNRQRIQFSLDRQGQTWQTLLAERDPADGLAADLSALVLDEVDAPAAARFADLHLGGSGLLAAPWSDGAAAHGVTLVHLRRRWQQRLALPQPARRAWVDAQDGIWLLGDDALWLARGGPLPQPYVPQPGRFEPDVVNPDPLRLRWRQPLPPHAGLLGLAASSGRLFVLVRASGGASPRMAVLSRPLSDAADSPWASHSLPATLPLATDIAALDDQRILLLPPLEAGATRQAARDCPLLRLPPGGAPRAHLLPERWPRHSEAAVRFVRHRDNLPRYFSADGVRRLYRLAQARLAASGDALIDAPLDAGSPDTHWDRIYLDACVPPGCRLAVDAWAGDLPVLPAGLPDTWLLPQPALLASPLKSELPFAAQADAAGNGDEGLAQLFEVLLQRPAGAVRELRGRYLRLRLRLQGDGRHSPAVFALRAWHPRFSWQGQYLPEHMRQQQAPDAADTGPANGADLRDRVLASFEGLWTPLEDRIAAAEMLLSPATAPPAQLPVLAELLAQRLPAAWPVARQRRWLASAGARQQRHGTLAALVLALDVLTDGAVRRGQVVPVEHFRLRRTLATVLGIDMDDDAHPLTLGTGRSGNSRVGDTLILSDDSAREFLALFAPEVASAPGDAAVVQRVFDDVARRLTVVLHGPARALARSVAEALPALVPATVVWAVRETDHPFVLGLSPLLGIDTYLETNPPPQPVVLDRSRLGRGDLLRNPVALSPEHALPVLQDE